jgi:hypothetical protein
VPAGPAQPAGVIEQRNTVVQHRGQTSVKVSTVSPGLVEPVTVNQTATPLQVAEYLAFRPLPIRYRPEAVADADWLKLAVCLGCSGVAVQSGKPEGGK